jgi:hypothetical protein
VFPVPPTGFQPCDYHGNCLDKASKNAIGALLKSSRVRANGTRPSWNVSSVPFAEVYCGQNIVLDIAAAAVDGFEKTFGSRLFTKLRR